MEVEVAFPIELSDFTYVVKVKLPNRKEVGLKDLHIDDYIQQTAKRVLAALDQGSKVLHEQQDKPAEE